MLKKYHGGAGNLSDRIKQTVSLRVLAERSGVTWDRAKTSEARGDFWSPCPFHGETTASFHVVEAGGVGGWFNCFGCGAKGSAIDFLMARDGLGVVEALKRLADDFAIDGPEDADKAAERAAQAGKRRAEADARAEARSARMMDHARRIWREAVPGAPDLLAYLAARGVDLDAIGGVPASIRYHPFLEFWTPDQDTRRDPPAHVGGAMVAAIGRGELVGVHRTWIEPTGRTRLPGGVKVPKKIIGQTGAIYGQPIRFCETRPAVVVGEGIETTLAFWSRLPAATRAECSAEAAVNLGALAGPADPAGRGPGFSKAGAIHASAIPDLASTSPHWLPASGVRSVLVLGEGSEKDPESARRQTERAVAKLTARGFEAGAIVPRGDWTRSADYADLAKEFRQ